MTPSPYRPPSTAKFPVEIITEEEMSLIEAAFSAAAAAPSVQFPRNVRSIRSITLLSKRRLSGCTELGDPDIEDSGRVIGSNSPNSKNRVLESFLHRFRRRRGLAVTDITSTEWCEKQMEFFLLLGRPKSTEAMKAGGARHLELEEEVVKRVKIDVESVEDVWTNKFINFISGVNQLLFDGLTRELPIVGFAEGVWMVGTIDEIRMPLVESERMPILVEIKTRVRDTLPAEPQRRNGRYGSGFTEIIHIKTLGFYFLLFFLFLLVGYLVNVIFGRLQLMCYKYLWDSLVADKFPSQKFFSYFSLNPHYILSPEVRLVTEKSGFPSETLEDLVRCFQNSCSLLPRAQDQLLLRYELQEDQSLLGEDKFDYEPEWFKSQIKSCLEFWQGKREAICTPTEERWKCNFCKFSSRCPAICNMDDSTTPPKNKDFLSPEIPSNSQPS